MFVHYIRTYKRIKIFKLICKDIIYKKINNISISFGDVCADVTGLRFICCIGHGT